MLVPLSWLREFTPYDGTALMLGERLTMLGLELDGIINPFQGLENIIVGYVAQCVSHPDSDHMHCCKVDIGGEELLDIVCGAPNVAEGQKVAVAPVGATLPDGLVIKKAKLRGQPSNGMICSERELGLSEDHTGIMTLPESVDVGHSLIAALGLETEVLDLAITPNRSDCLSILGIAREVAAAYKLPLHVPELPLILDERDPALEVAVSIDDPALCSLYAGRIVTDASVNPSPMRMRYRLFAVGIRPISNLVDVTNYILIECGQPLHAFDLDKLSGQKIIVRKARPGETLVTLDGKDRRLQPEDLCICDAEKPVALAGVMGGANSEITDSTHNIFIESAVFSPVSIRRTSRRLGLQSEASYRFERGIDQRRSVWALDRACAMMASICGGYARKGFSIAEPRPFMAAKIDFSPRHASSLLGLTVDPAFQDECLTSLGCAVEKTEPDAWIVVQPSWRPDLIREADLVEEVGRMYGMDQIVAKLPAIRRNLEDNLSPHGEFDFNGRIKQWGAGLGLHEVINYSFVGQKDLDKLEEPVEGRLQIRNPLSEEQDTLRTSLAPGLLQDLSNNLAYGASGIRIFEIANVFVSDDNSETGVKESSRLGILLSGARHDIPWPKRDEDFAYADIKGVLENLCAYLHMGQPELAQNLECPSMTPCVEISINGTHCGVLGRIKPNIAKTYNALKPVWLMELELDVLRILYQEIQVQFHALPIYPAVRRDITVKAPRSMKASEILEKFTLLNLPVLEGAVLADAYEKPGEDDRYLTFRLTFRHGKRTLKDSEVDKERDRIVDSLKANLGVEI